MRTGITYPPGVPCWVDNLQRDVARAGDFYAQLFGWELAGPGPMPDGGAYYVARVDGRDVAGIGSLPAGSVAPPAWTTYVRVDNLDSAAARTRHAGGTILTTFEAPPAGRGAILACPRGSVLGLWEPGSREGAQLVNAPRAWAMSALRTNDIENAIAFYGATFGWQPETFGTGEGAVTLARLPGYVGGKEQQPVPRDVVACMLPTNDDAAPVWSVDFWVDDADATAAQAERLGGRIVVEPYDTPIFRQAVLADREGATFSISQLLMAA